MAVVKIIGGAGTGKTTKLMRVLESLIQAGIDPLEIGFASFTKIAVLTAAERAAETLGMERELLTENGWYRTLHASCYHILGLKQNQLLTDSESSSKWLEDTFGMPLPKMRLNPDTGFPELDATEQGELARFLAWWAFTRNTLSDPSVTFTSQLMCMVTTEKRAARMAAHYERCKRRDGMFDFCDLQLAVAGIRYRHDGLDTCRPAHGIPSLRAWIFDEYQDTSPLAHAVATRLASQPTVEHVYTSGDYFQSIYGFSGGDPGLFLAGFNYDLTEHLQQSYRCPPEVLRFSENIVRCCTDYFDRGVAPKSGGDGLFYSIGMERLPYLQIGDNDQTWLLLARTNQCAARITRHLNKLHIPWDTTVGGTYLHYRLRNVARYITALRAGKAITPTQWASTVAEIPAATNGTALLKPGVKLQASEGELYGIPRRVTLGSLEACGATRWLVSILAGDGWADLVPALRRYEDARKQYGDAALAPTVRVGTIHSVKGDEADNVVLYDAMSQRSKLNMFNGGGNEERRVWYVGASRAKERLFVGHYKGDKKSMF